jgi:hypothetical protein
MVSIGKQVMIAESPLCCKMYANFPKCTHLGTIITPTSYNMTEAESPICCKMYGNDAICMQMRFMCMSNVYIVALFPPSKQYKGSKNAKYVRMYTDQLHKCMYAVHDGKRSTHSTSNNLFMHVVCPPPPPTTNREATSCKQYLCVHTTWKYRPAGKHTQHSGHTQSSTYSGTASNPAPVHFVRKKIINRYVSFRRMRLLCSYICIKIRLILVRQLRYLCPLLCTILAAILFLRMLVVIEHSSILSACREKYKKMANNFAKKKTETVAACFEYIQGYNKENDVTRAGTIMFYYRSASIHKEVYLSVRISITKMSESGSRSEGGGSGKYIQPSGAYLPTCWNLHSAADLFINIYIHTLTVAKLLSIPCHLSYICTVLCLLVYANENHPISNFLQNPLYAVEPFSMLTICIMLRNCSLRYGE